MRRCKNLKEYKKTKTQGRNLMCKLAVMLAPSVSEFCRGSYYQPNEPDNLKEFVTPKICSNEGKSNEC